MKEQARDMSHKHHVLGYMNVFYLQSSNNGCCPLVSSFPSLLLSFKVEKSFMLGS
jgi:hypothetical protein